MSRDFTLLVNPFEKEARRLLADLLREGVQMRAFFTQRIPWDQARLWRQSRTTQEIHLAAAMLAREGAPFLREVLLSVGPQEGRWATNALPGQSWHQWGEALDCFVLEHGKAVWRRTHPGYLRYAELARERGMHPGYFWSRPDAVHVQWRERRVRSLYTWAQINAEMLSRFGSSEDASIIRPDPAGRRLAGLAALSTEELVELAEEIAGILHERRNE